MVPTPNIRGMAMPSYRRWRVEGGTYFFTIVSHQRRRILTPEPSRRFLRTAMVDARCRRQGYRGVWAKRFWEHMVRDAADFRMHLDYIHLNPVKHGLVARPKDWPWSTFRRWVRRGEYEPDWVGRIELPGAAEYFWHDS
jgi:REP element-mobilizing transposase RayT